MKKSLALAVFLPVIVSAACTPLAATERRGATVEAFLTDGRVVRGELLSVKEDALILYIQSIDCGERLDLQRVDKVRLFKKSNFLQGLGIGLLVGLALSEYSYGIEGNDHEMSGLIFVVLPPQTALAGGIYGALSSLSRTIQLAGESTACLHKSLRWLAHHAREQDAGQAPRRTWQRFRLLWSPSRQNISANNDLQGASGTFRFLDDVPSNATTAYPFVLNPHIHTHVRADRFRLEYDLTPHLSPSLEFIASAKLNNNVYLEASYFSVDRGMRYQSNVFIGFQYYYNSLLLGLNWKPVSPSAAGRHRVELGIAAGPARVKLNSRSFLSSAPSPELNRMSWSCNGHAAYDFLWMRNISIGVFIGFQYLRATFPGAAFVSERQEFWPQRQDNSAAFSFTRRTEFTLSGHRIRLDGTTFGFRVGLRF